MRRAVLALTFLVAVALPAPTTHSMVLGQTPTRGRVVTSVPRSVPGQGTASSPATPEWFGRWVRGPVSLLLTETEAKTAARVRSEDEAGVFMNRFWVWVTLPRGSIVDRNGVVLAMTDARGRRHYPLGDAAFHPIGRIAGATSGMGLEHAASALLRGEHNKFDDRLRAFAGDVHTGPDVRATLDADLQRLAFQLLDGRSGAAVVMDARDGALLALASAPAPAVLSDPDATWGDAARSPDLPMRNRAPDSIDGYSPPGSAFKPVVAAAALSLLEDFDANDTIFCPGSDADLRVRCSGHRAHGTVDLARALTVSCNVYFGRLGDSAPRVRARPCQRHTDPDGPNRRRVCDRRATAATPSRASGGTGT